MLINVYEIKVIVGLSENFLFFIYLFLFVMDKFKIGRI